LGGAAARAEEAAAEIARLGIVALRRGNRRSDATLVLRNVDAMQRALRIADTH
jgi:hypothetical protein